MKKTIKVEISYKTIIFSFLFLLGIMALWYLKSILALFFVCIILTEALNPIVVKLEKNKISRTVSILLIYMIGLIFLSIALASIVPPLITQVNGLINFLPKAINNLDVLGINASNISSQLKLLEGLPAGIAKTTISIFSNIFGGIVVLMITFYMLLERQKMDMTAKKLLGLRRASILMEVIGEVENRLTSWTKAEGLLMLIVGGLSYIGYALLGLDFALALAIIAGILEIVPNIGPTVTTVLAAIVALNKSFLTVILTIIWGILVQQAENNLITPRVMSKQVGLSPVVTIFALAIGAKFGGVIGTLLAIPSFLAIETTIRVLMSAKKDK